MAKPALVAAAIPILLAVLVFMFQARDLDTGEGVESSPHADAEEPSEPTASAVADLASASDHDMTDSDIEACADSLSLNQELKAFEDIAPLLEQAVTDLLASNDAELQLAAGLLLTNSESEAAFEKINAAARTGTSPQLAMWRLLVLCGQRDIEGCYDEAVDEQAIRADAGNGMMWVQVAARRLHNGDAAAAFEALREAVAAPRFDTYFVQQVELLDRALAAVSGLSYTERLLYTGEYIAESPGNFDEISRRCSVDDNGVWAELCDQLGQRLMSESIDTQLRKRGARLRESVLENAGDAAGLEALEAEIRQLDAVSSTLLDSEEVINLLLNDEAVLRDFFHNIAAYGEHTAALRLNDDVERLQGTPGYDQCNFVANPYIRLGPLD